MAPSSRLSHLLVGGAVPRKPFCKPGREVLPGGGALCPFLLAGFLFSAQPLQSSLPVKRRPADLNPEPPTASSVGSACKPDGSSPFECLIDSLLFSIPWPTQLRPQPARPPVSPLHSVSRILLHPELPLPLSSSRALRGFPVPSEESQPVSEALLGLECACLALPSTRPLACIPRSSYLSACTSSWNYLTRPSTFACAVLFAQEALPF